MRTEGARLAGHALWHVSVTSDCNISWLWLPIYAAKVGVPLVRTISPSLWITTSQPLAFCNSTGLTDAIVSNSPGRVKNSHEIETGLPALPYNWLRNVRVCLQRSDANQM